MKNKTIRCLGIDWGKKRIGLALGDSETGIATPFKVAGSINEILEIIKSEDINSVVVGRPISIVNHELGIMNQEYNNFIGKLKEKTNITVEFFDERLSSKAADALSGDKKTKAARDAVAAMIILQSYLDKKSICHPRHS
jgi:putative Holliday junction resolvase